MSEKKEVTLTKHRSTMHLLANGADEDIFHKHINGKLLHAVQTFTYAVNIVFSDM